MKVKKVLAMLLASAMIMGSAVTTFAAVPQENDSATVSVSDVDIDSTVYAYQIVEATYNSSGFTGYISVKDGDQNLVADPENPTSSEVGNIAQRINSGELSSLTRVQLTDEEDDGTYTGTLNPGYWVVLVRTTGGDVKVYNPMLVGVYYTENGENGQLTSSPVSANSNWNLETVNAWAKSSDIPFEKTADSDTENLGGTVVYTISTEIPQYGPEYSDVTFDVKDTLTDLELTDGTITVQEKVGEEWTNIANSDGSAYEIEGNTAGSKTFTVSFKSDWIKNNGGKEIQIVYTATVTGTGVNTDSNDNYAELTYTNNPDSSTGGQTDIEKIYTSNIKEIDDFIKNNNIKIPENIVFYKNNKELNEILPNVNHQGYISFVKKRKSIDFQDFINEKCKNKNDLPRLIILDQLTDPHNIGAIIRTSFAFNVKYIIKTKYNSPSDISVITKTSVGLSEFINIIEVSNLNNAINSLKNIGYFVLGLAGEAKEDIKTLKDNKNICIVVGNEGNGIRQLVKKNCDMLYKITMQNNVESLNVSVATAIVIYKIWG